jgi:hypothetical protein
MNFDITTYMIYVHAALGGVALLAGIGALITKKGSKKHIKSGRVFYYGMLGSVILAIIVSLLPDHQNPFLFGIGIFSGYLIISGFRAIRYKNSEIKLLQDKILSYIMIAAGLGMILFPVLVYQEFNIVLAVFGGIGLFLALKDLSLYRNAGQLKRNYLKLHLSKMIGGFIAATTAFIVVNEIIPGIYGWLSPTAVGLFVIGYWRRKV